MTTRAHVRTVVTEWGVAELFGRSLRERATALIAIAHPDFRDGLTAEARGAPPDLASVRGPAPGLSGPGGRAARAHDALPAPTQAARARSFRAGSCHLFAGGVTRQPAMPILSLDVHGQSRDAVEPPCLCRPRAW